MSLAVTHTDELLFGIQCPTHNAQWIICVHNTAPCDARWIQIQARESAALLLSKCVGIRLVNLKFA